MACKQTENCKKNSKLTGEEAIKFALEEFAKVGPEIEELIKKRERIAREARFRFLKPLRSKRCFVDDAQSVSLLRLNPA